MMTRPLALGGLLAAACVGAAGATAPAARAADMIKYSFEEGLEGWAIPDWAKASPDYVAADCVVDTAAAEDGQASLKLDVSFPGERWTGAYVERETDVIDWMSFGSLTVSVYLPPEAPTGLTGKIILTVGDEWVWTEMNRSLPLAPGAWTPISVSLKPSSMDWKFFPEPSFRTKVRKIGVRVESDKGPVYTGPVLIDHVRLAE